MDTLEHKSLETKPHELTYSYYLSPGFHAAVKKGIPVLLLNHGFPDDAHMWAGAVPAFLKTGYPFVLPDLLGFDGSSKPTDPTMYNYRKQASSLSQILDKEGVPAQKSVIVVGHDWGSAVSQRFYLYHRERCLGLGMISLAYQIPSPDPFDMHAVNDATVKIFGYPQWEYWNFFTAPDASEVMKANVDRFYAVNHGNFPSDVPEENGRDIWMRKMFCAPNGMREYITGTGKYKDYTVDLKPYARDPKLQQRFRDRMLRDGFEGPVCYYHTLKNNTMLEDERELCAETGASDKRRIDVPVLYIGQTGDWVCRTDLMKDAKEQGLVDDLEEHAMESGHWTLYERPEENARLIIDWVQRRFPIAN